MPEAIFISYTSSICIPKPVLLTTKKSLVREVQYLNALHIAV